MAKPEPKRISQLDAASPLTGAEQFPLVQNTKTVKASLDTIKDYTDTSCQCTLVSRYNEVGNDANTSLKYLQTYTLPGNTVSTDGSWLHIFAAGKFAANANFKDANVALFRNGLSIGAGYGTNSTVYNNAYWELTIRIQRTSDSTYTSYRRITVTPYNGGAVAGNTPDMFQDYKISSTYANLWDNDIQIVVTGESSAASANDVTCGQLIVVLHKVDPNS